MHESLDAVPDPCPELALASSEVASYPGSNNAGGGGGGGGIEPGIKRSRMRQTRLALFSAWDGESDI